MKKIGVIGAGKLGLCLALNLEGAGYTVIATDVNEHYIEQLRKGSHSTNEPQVMEMMRAAKNISYMSDYTALSDCDLLFVVVPTPSEDSGAFSDRYLEEVINTLEEMGCSKTRQTLVINSTTMPGYCDGIADRLESINFDLVYNPEFIAQGSVIKDQLHPDQVLIGANNSNAADLVASVYRNMCKNSPEYHIMDLKSAEITKLATNCFLTMKISFANHIGDLALKVGADPHKILDCIGSDNRIGKKYLNYGFGFGGPCFPRDNKAMLHFGSENDHQLHLSESTDRINEEHFEFQLNSLLERNLKEYFFEDVAYKVGSDILEEAQQLRLAVALAKNGANVRVRASQDLQKRLSLEYPDLFSFDDG